MSKYFFMILGLFVATPVVAQQKESANATQANNPLADMTAVNVQNNYVTKLTNAPEGAYQNTSWLRFAKPLAGGKLLFRASAPLVTTGVPDQSGKVNTVNGFGDINAFMSYNFVSKATLTMGAGPMLTAPTAAKDALGTGQWLGGLAFVAFIARSPVFQFGGLVTWQASFAGDAGRPDVNFSALQPFYFWQLGKGTYLRGAPNWVFDFENGSYNVPMGLGVGQVIKMNRTVFNVFIEPQYTMLHQGVQPQFQVYTGINVQFSK